MTGQNKGTLSDYDEALARMTEVDRMYYVADDYEADVLDALRRRADITWECYGATGESSCWTNVTENATCEHCGTPRSIGGLRDFERDDA